MNETMLHFVFGEEDLYPANLELQYPRIFEKIIHLWLTPQMEAYFLELMLNTRSDRHGFSREVVDELYYLSRVFEGTRNFPKVFDENPLAQLGGKLHSTGQFEHSPQGFINMRSPSNDGPWVRIAADSRFAIESAGYPCTPAGFLKAIGAKDLKAIGLFLHCDINIDTCDERGWSPLFLAAFNGNMELAKIFIELGANVNLKDIAGFTPVHWAAFNGHADVIKYLVTHNADINARSLRDCTPLMMAAMNGHLAACSALLASGAESDAVSGQGWTALQKASVNHHLPVIKLFLSLMKDHVRLVRLTADTAKSPD